MNGARALVYPSFYEGFGLPPVEMMACGGAVLCSTAGALVETVGARAHLVEPLDEDGWRAALHRVAVDDDWHAELRRGAVEVGPAVHLGPLRRRHPRRLSERLRAGEARAAKGGVKKESHAKARRMYSTRPIRTTANSAAGAGVVPQREEEKAAADVQHQGRRRDQERDALRLQDAPSHWAGTFVTSKTGMMYQQTK